MKLARGDRLEFSEVGKLADGKILLGSAAEAEPAPPPTEAEIAEELSARGHGGKVLATLVDLLIDRYAASYAEVADALDDPDISDGAIRQNVLRLNRAVRGLRGTLVYRCEGRRIVKRDASDP